MQQLVQVKEESFREQLLIENEKFEQAKVRRLMHGGFWHVID